MYKRLPVYRAMPASLKALGIIVCIAPGFAIQAERRGIEFDRSQWYACLGLMYQPCTLTLYQEGRRCTSPQRPRREGGAGVGCIEHQRQGHRLGQPA